MNLYEEYPSELYHHCVKGMKWGVRRGPKLATSDMRKRYDSAKEDYKTAKKAYNKSFNKAYNYSSLHAIGQYTNKNEKAESNRRWNDALDKAGKLNDAQKAYKQVKADRKQKIKDVQRDINKKTTLGERLLYNDATRKKAAKYIVDNNMSVKEANQRAKSDAKKNTAVILAAYGAVTMGTLYATKRM